MGKIVALIQARMSSSRLPGKVLAEIGGKPSILFMVDRVRRATTLDEIVVVTSIDPSDDPLALALAAAGVACFRGPLDDVLSRYAAAASFHEADVVVRLTGDCPLVDPAIVDRVVGTLIESGCDYASNIDPPSFADGLDVECFTRAALIRAGREASAPAEREHVTLWMRSGEAGLERRCVRSLIDSSHLRLTVDYPDDLALVRTLVTLLGDAAGGFDHYDILRCLDQRPDLLETNRHERNEGLSTGAGQGPAGPSGSPPTE
jgi:spore coat polysaccharide biosynthesis protein SpsF (cytidylyltransferase family)